jgi:hypothetical protein
MLPAISLRLTFCDAVNVWGIHRISSHFIPKDFVKWFRTVVELMFKAFAIFLAEKRGSSLSAFLVQ